MSKTDRTILVTGGTGAQGGATARELITAGYRVRILTRSTNGAAARALARQGAEIVQGDMNDPASLIDGMRDAYGVFSVQTPDITGNDLERRHGFALVEAARRSGVRHFVHTSVCEA